MINNSDSATKQDKPAGKFSTWLKATKDSLQGKSDANVPCGECVACCTSSYFIHIKPSDTATLKHIPRELVFPAPGAPEGHYLLGYDEKGHCPMFSQGKCSIYEFRPQTCRQYDCRVFPATGLEIDDKDKTLISRQAKRWTFDISTDEDAEEIKAVQAAAKFLTTYADRFPEGFVPSNTTQQAVVAISVHELFLPSRGIVENAEVDDIVNAIVEADKGFN